ncbi:DNA-binding protein [Enterobacter asburiae]
MNNEWVLAKELCGVGGLPKTIQGIHKRAQKEGWQKQNVIQEGIKGRAIGYRISSLPIEVQELLLNIPVEQRGGHNKKANDNELDVFFCALSDEEKRNLIQVLARHGVSLLVELLDESTPELLKLSMNRKKLALLSRHMTDEYIKEISDGFQERAKRHSVD